MGCGARLCPFREDDFKGNFLIGPSFIEWVRWSSLYPLKRHVQVLEYGSKFNKLYRGRKNQFVFLHLKLSPRRPPWLVTTNLLVQMPWLLLLYASSSCLSASRIGSSAQELPCWSVPSWMISRDQLCLFLSRFVSLLPAFCKGVNKASSILLNQLFSSLIPNSCGLESFFRATFCQCHTVNEA